MSGDIMASDTVGSQSSVGTRGDVIIQMGAIMENYVQHGRGSLFLPCRHVSSCQHVLCVDCHRVTWACKHPDFQRETLNCKLCGSAMVKKQADHQRGWFMRCTSFPLCRRAVPPRDAQALASKHKSMRVQQIEVGVLERILMDANEPSRSL
eukprot:1174898-Amphidinium_carterae.1